MFVGRWYTLGVTVMVLAASGCSSGGESNQANNSRGSDQDEMFAESLRRNQGVSVDMRAAADMAHVACESPVAGVGLYNAQKEMQQRYPEYNLNTVSIVMAQGILVYCPGRLP